MPRWLNEWVKMWSDNGCFSFKQLHHFFFVFKFVYFVVLFCAIFLPFIVVLCVVAYIFLSRERNYLYLVTHFILIVQRYSSQSHAVFVRFSILFTCELCACACACVRVLCAILKRSECTVHVDSSTGIEVSAQYFCRIPTQCTSIFVEVCMHTHV